jgi:hypothetical protein
MADITGGDKLTRVLADMGRGVEGSPYVRVGFLEGATYPTTEKAALRAEYKARKRKRIKGAVAGEMGGLPVATVAAWNEFGTQHTPPRPFFRTMIAAKAPTWGKDVAVLIAQDNFDAKKALGQMGERIAGQLRKSIVELTSPPLSPVTIKRKGFSKPLVDTGHMLNSVDYEVKE